MLVDGVQGEFRQGRAIVYGVSEDVECSPETFFPHWNVEGEARRFHSQVPLQALGETECDGPDRSVARMLVDFENDACPVRFFYRQTLVDSGKAVMEFDLHYIPMDSPYRTLLLGISFSGYFH
jgi:hypothetical protein